MKRTNLLTGVISVAIMAAFAASVFLLDQRGRASRTYAGPAYTLTDPGLSPAVVETSAELYNLYKSKKVKGRVLVHIGKYLHAVDIPIERILPAGSKYPGSITEIQPMYEALLSYDNCLWVASQGNIVRDIYYFQPPVAFRDRLDRITEKDADVISMGNDTIILHDWGERRTISAHLPHISEPAILNIDASVFDEIDPEGLLNTLKQSSLTADLITLNLSRDNPDVTDKERTRLRTFAGMLTGGTRHGD